MKKRLNIFALLILMALSIHTGYTLFYSWGEISTAYKEGYENCLLYTSPSPRDS